MTKESWLAFGFLRKTSLGRDKNSGRSGLMNVLDVDLLVQPHKEHRGKECDDDVT